MMSASNGAVRGSTLCMWISREDYRSSPAGSGSGDGRAGPGGREIERGLPRTRSPRRSGMGSVVHRRLLGLESEQVPPQTPRRLRWGQRLMAAYLEFKRGAVVPVHQHEHEQLTHCISGLMRFTLPDGELLLRQGEGLLIPGNVPHGAEFLEDTVEMDFFSPPRQDWIDKTDAYLRRCRSAGTAPPGAKFPATPGRCRWGGLRSR